MARVWRSRRYIGAVKSIDDEVKEKDPGMMGLRYESWFGNVINCACTSYFFLLGAPGGSQHLTSPSEGFGVIGTTA